MFSIVMPVWNRAALVGRSIRSVLAQTFTDWELLVVDDGSTDGTAEAVAPFVSEKVRYVRTPHQGVSGARNEGLRLATQPYIAYLDSDVTWDKEFLAVFAAALAGASGRREIAYCTARVYRTNPADGQEYLAEIRGEPFNLARLIGGNYIDMNTLVHSRTCYELLGGFDPELRRYVDWDLVLKYAVRFEPLFVPRDLVNYFAGAADNAISLTEDPAEPISRITAKYRAFLPPVRLQHDGIDYVFDNLPAEKYDNWVRMNQCATPDTVGYAAYGYPCVLQIEPTSLCNLKCTLCPVGRGELNRKRHMTLPEFKAIIDDMERWLLLLVMWDWGEPLCNPELPEMIRYAADRGIRTVTSTNAHFLNDGAYIRRLLSSGLSTLIVAIDSLCQDRYESYRQAGDLGRAVEGLKNLCRAKKELGSSTCIALRMVLMRQNEHERSRLRKLARRVGADRFCVKTVNPSCGVAADESVVPADPRLRRYVYQEGTMDRVRISAHCQRVWFMSNIFSDGQVVPCCYDYDARLAVGNCFQTPFSQLWASPQYRSLRERIYRDKDAIERCHACGVNFQLAHPDWMLESTDLTGTSKALAPALQPHELPPMTPFRQFCRRTFYRGPVRALGNSIRHRLVQLLG